MEKAFRHILRFIVAATYVFAYMGFGIHTCHDDGSRHFVWMMGDVSCEAIHHHSHDADHDHHHDGRCCTTQVYVLTDAQDYAPSTGHIAAPELLLPVFFDIPATLSETSAFIPVSDGNSPPLKLIPSQSFLSVWRA